MQPFPRSMIATQPQYPLHPQGIRSIFLASDLPNQVKPYHQRLTSPMKDRPRCNCALRITVRTLKTFTSNFPRLPMTALGAFKTIWLPQINEIFSACILGRKTFLKFQQCPWVIFNHTATLHLVVTGVNCIPQF